MTLQIFTGNRVADGIVVFLAADGSWTESLDRSLVVDGDEELAHAAETAEAAAEAAVAVDPYAIEVREENGAIRPLRYRERIRAYGPPVHPDFAKRSAPGGNQGG